MRKKRKLNEGILSVLLMIAVAATIIPAGFVLYSQEAFAATTYSYTLSRPSVVVKGHKIHVATFTVSGLGLKGTCCQAGTDAKSGKATVKKLSNTDIRAKLLYYYGYQKGYLGRTDKNGVLLGRALSWSGGNTKLYPITRTEVTNFINAMPSNVVVPNRFECYFCDPTNGSQNFIAYKMNPPAYVTLKKTSSDQKSLTSGSGYSFEGIEYTVYNSSGTSVGKLTCKANGTTNKLTLDTGTYTVKETKTNKWYKLNTKTFTKTLASGQTWSIAASDSPLTGTIHIKKEVTGNYEGDLAFAFRLTNTANTSIAYTVKTDATTGEADVQVLQGTYRCEEVLSEDSGLIDITGAQTASVKIGETCAFERKNKALSSGMLQISKSTNDGGSAEGFRFKVTGELYNQGEITSEKVLEEVDPDVSDFDKELYELGEWEVSDQDIAQLNKAAANRQTGRQTVRISNTLKYTGPEGIEIPEILAGLDSDSNEGTIEKGTIIKDGRKYYKALEEVTFKVPSEEPEEVLRAPAVRGVGDGSETEETGNEEEPEEAEEEEDREDAAEDPADENPSGEDQTEEMIRELLSGDQFQEVNISDIVIKADISIDLRPVEYISGTDETDVSGYETDLNQQIKNVEEHSRAEKDYKLSYCSFDWNGAATLYQEIKNGQLTGNTEVVLETGADGTTPEVEEGITYGKFTVEEIMTDAQKKRYHQPSAQTKEISKDDGLAAFVFSFQNQARWTGIHLLKTSEDGNVSGISFKLEGTDSRGEKISQEAVTDESGRIDFGKLYPGDYVISEMDFDPEKYENRYKLDGYDVPAQKLSVTGDETEDITVSFENVPLKSLYITKIDKESRLFLKNAVFALNEDDQQIALFRLVLDDYGQAGIEMISLDENSGLYVGTPEVSLFQENEEQDEGAQDERTQSGEENTDPSEKESEEENEEGDAAYNFAVIKGLKEGRSYTIKELTAPAGYAASVDETFEFKDGQQLILENAAPQISTTAVDKATKIHMSDAEGTVTIVDTVSYTNLGPGHEYLLSGVLALKPDGERTVEELERDAEEIEIVKDAKGRDVTAEKTFVPETENGTVDLEFTFDASLLDGRKVVAMEQVVDPALSGINGVITVVASHEDIEDEAQSIYFPKVGTVASADDTAKNITEADGDITITDTVEYSNVITGKIYEITGTLMDRDTGEPLLSAGKEITASVKFRADREGPVFAAEGEELTETQEEELSFASGTVEIHFQFDGTGLEGKSAVAFEKLTTGGALIGEHSDIQDEAQTVFLPAIETTASTNGTDKVTDRVDYRNLLPGETYIMRGILMDKATGTELQLKGESITAEQEFVPESQNGSMVMEFPVNVQELQGKSAVVFETCFLVSAAGEEQIDGSPSEVEIISHKDINNKAQTVTFDVPQTGQPAPWVPFAAAGLLAILSTYAWFRNLRRGSWI